MGIRSGNGGQRLRDGVLKSLPGASLDCAQGGFELRPATLDRRQIGRIWRQILQPCPRLFNGLADASGFVRPQVVHDHDVSRAQRRAEDLCHIDAEYVGISGPLDRHHGLNAVASQRRQHGDIRPVILGHRADDPLPLGGTAIQAGHGEIHARFIDELEALGIERRNFLVIGRSCLLDTLGVLFAGVERLFLRGKLSAMTRRPMVGTLTRRPC
jgi:hypothetical protein